MAAVRGEAGKLAQLHHGDTAGRMQKAELRIKK